MSDIKRVLLIDVSSDESVRNAAYELTSKIENSQINIIDQTEVERENGDSNAEKLAVVAGTCVTFLMVCSEALTKAIDEQDYSRCNDFYRSEEVGKILQTFCSNENLKSCSVMVFLEKFPCENPEKFKDKSSFSDKATEDDINKLRSKIMSSSKAEPIPIEKKKKEKGCKVQ